jgi:hypothetical protein
MSRTVTDTPDTLFSDFPFGEAVISDDEVYRYVLNRRWAEDGPVMTWIGLNPSTADAKTDDQTIRQMVYFAKREGCRGICVVNLYALRATDPKQLLADLGRAVGPENDQWLAGLTPGTVDGPVVAAWGANEAARMSRPGTRWGRAVEVRRLIRGVPLVCLGTTKDGAPRHPCRIGRATALVPLPAI